MTINAATNDGVLIVPATEIVIVAALEIADAAPHAVQHAVHQTLETIVVAGLAVGAALRIITHSVITYELAVPVVTDPGAIIILKVPTISSS